MALILGAALSKISKIFCDKLSIVLDYKSPGEQAYIVQSIEEALTTKFGFPAYSYPYTKGIQFPEPWIANKTGLNAQWAPKSPDTGFLRIEFNPRTCDMDSVHLILQSVLPGGITDLLYRARVTRFDVACDVKGVLPHELLICYSNKGISKVYNKSGRVESIYIGLNGENNRVLVYDKNLHIREMNKKHGTKIPLDPDKHTRIEIKMMPNQKIENLLGLANPFLPMVVTKPLDIESKDETWRLFVDLSRYQGAHASLLRLSPETRKKFKLKMAAAPGIGWNPATLWAQWPTLVKEVFGWVL